MGVENYTNPYRGLPEIQYAKNVFQKDEQAASEKNFNDARDAALFDSAIELMLDERHYNSPAEQAKRFRQAGLNPDLMAIDSGDSGTTPNVSPSPFPVHDGGSQTDAIMNMSQAFIQTIPQAVQLVQSIKANNLSLESMELDVTEKADRVAQMEIGRQFNLDDFKSKTSFPVLDVSGYSKRSARRIDNAVSKYIFDVNNNDFAKGLIYGKKSLGQSVRKGYLDIISQSGFSLDDDTFVKVLKEYNDVVRSASKNKSSYDSTYYGNLNGKTRADAENAAYNKQGLEAQNDVMPQLFARANSLMDSDKRGERGAGILLYVLTTLLQSKVSALGK